MKRFLGYLPKESATVREVMGDEARWGDNEYLLALVVDWLGHIDYILAVSNSEKGKGPKKPPELVRRPGQLETTAQIGTIYLNGKPMVTADALSLEELDRAIEQQTGVKGGVSSL